MTVDEDAGGINNYYSLRQSAANPTVALAREAPSKVESAEGPCLAPGSYTRFSSSVTYALSGFR
jgi:hypothetical protein